MGYEAFASGAARARPARRDDPAGASTPIASPNIRRSCITITELADTLVRREGLSFRLGA
jgi:argininosuccinate lyase